MKTNKILMAVALPALLAACTAEEIVEQSPVANISGRALLDPNFSVSVAEGAESRFAWEGYNWKFEEGDQFGAAVTDVAEQGKVTGSSLIGNYIFSKNEAGNWITDSQMSEGIYQYYSFEGFKTKQARELVAFDLTGQEAILSEADAELNKYENQLMITPLYTLQEKYSTKALPLEFYSYYGVGAIKFKNIAGQDLKITQIIVNADEMVVKGRVNPKDFETWAEYVYNEEAEKYVLEKVDKAMKAYNESDKTAADKKAKENAIKDAEKTFEDNIYTVTAAAEADPEKGDKTSTFITLDCNNYLLKEGKTATAYMMLPAGAKNIHVEIMVVDEDGEAWSVYVTADGNFPVEEPDDSYTDDPDAIKVKDLEDLVIKRHKTNSIFGKTTDGKGIKNIEITEDNLVENSGYYVDNKADLMALLDNDLGDIKIHNSGDLYIDEDIVEAINEYTGAGVSFSNPIEIKSTEELTEENDLQLSDVKFAGLIVKGVNEDEDFEGTVIELGDDVVVGKLTVEVGATATVLSGSEITEAKNNGTLNVKDGAEVEEAVNNGVLNTEIGSIEIENNGDLNYSAVYNTNGSLKKYVSVNASDLDLNAGGDLTVGKNVTLVINEDFEIALATETNENGVETVTAYSVLTNNGTIVMNDNLKISGKFINNGIVGGNGELTVACTVLDTPATDKPDQKSYYGASVTNNADAEINEVDIVVEAYGLDKYKKSGRATVENAGEFGIGSDEVKLYGKVTMKGGNSRLYVTEFENTTTGAEGEVDNTENGVIEDYPAGMWISAKLGAMTNGEKLSEFDTDSQINKIYVNGKWTITTCEEEKETAEYWLKKLGIEVVEFTTKNAVDVRSEAKLDLSGVTVVVSGVEEVIFNGRTDGTSTIKLGEIVKGLWKTVSGVDYMSTWNVKYLNLEQSGASVVAALKASTAENPVKLFGNVTDGIVYSSNSAAFLDLNGFNVENEELVKWSDNSGNEYVDNIAIEVKGGTLTIAGEGKVVAKDADYSMAVYANGGNVVINGGSYENKGISCDLIYAGTGKITVEKGYFKASGPSDFSQPGTKNTHSALNCKDANATAGIASIDVKGGTFVNFNPAANKSESSAQPWTSYLNAGTATLGYRVDTYMDGNKTATKYEDVYENTNAFASGKSIEFRVVSYAK